MSKTKALKFGLISGGIIAVLWFLKYRMAIPAQQDGGEAEESAGGGGGGGIGGSTDLNGLNHLSNNLPNNSTAGTSALGSPVSVSGSTIASMLSAPKPSRQLAELSSAATSLGATTPTRGIGAELGFNGKTTLGFIDDERKLRAW